MVFFKAPRLTLFAARMQVTCLDDKTLSFHILGNQAGFYGYMAILGLRSIGREGPHVTALAQVWK